MLVLYHLIFRYRMKSKLRGACLAQQVIARALHLSLSRGKRLLSPHCLNLWMKIFLAVGFCAFLIRWAMPKSPLHCNEWSPRPLKENYLHEAPSPLKLQTIVRDEWGCWLNLLPCHPDTKVREDYPSPYINCGHKTITKHNMPFQGLCCLQWVSSNLLLTASSRQMLMVEHPGSHVENSRGTMFPNDLTNS